jgi:hypothetical protein
MLAFECKDCLLKTVTVLETSIIYQ